MYKSFDDFRANHRTFYRVLLRSATDRITDAHKIRLEEAKERLQEAQRDHRLVAACKKPESKYVQEVLDRLYEAEYKYQNLLRIPRSPSVPSEQAKIMAEKEVREYCNALLLGRNPDEIFKWNLRLSQHEKMLISEMATTFRQFNWENPVNDVACDLNRVGGWYMAASYDVKAMTEVTLGWVKFHHEKLARITENSYGATILNCDRTMFVDIDLPDNEYEDWSSESCVWRSESDAINNLEQFCTDNKGLGFDVFRTAGGLRLLETTTTFDPTSNEVQNIFKKLGADPLYAKLCKNQETFRVRVSPKPWRVNADKDDEDYSVCSFLGHIGVQRMDLKVAAISSAHAQCIGNKPLA